MELIVIQKLEADLADLRADCATSKAHARGFAVTISELREERMRLRADLADALKQIEELRREHESHA